MRLFNYVTDDGTIRLLISRQVESVVEQGVGGRTTKANLVTNKVKFEYLGANYDDSYLVLSAVSSLVTVFLRGQFGQNSKQTMIQEHHAGALLEFKAQKTSFQDGSYPALTLIAPEGGKRLTLTIPYIHQLNSALHKAITWIAPEPEWLT